MEGKRLGVLVATVAVAGAIGGAASNILVKGGIAFAERRNAEKVVRAEKIELVDATGHPRAWLEIDPDGNPGLFLGRQNCIMGSFSLVGAGKPRLDFGDDCGVRAVLKVDEAGNPSLTFLDRNRKTIWAAP